jgi:hypothetical protein
MSKTMKIGDVQYEILLEWQGAFGEYRHVADKNDEEFIVRHEPLKSNEWSVACGASGPEWLQALLVMSRMHREHLGIMLSVRIPHDLT